MKNIIIRADAGGLLGTGHVMRMIALAQALQERGVNVTIAVISCPDLIKVRIKEERIELKLLGSEVSLGSSEDSVETLKLCKGLDAQWLITDGYHFSGEYQKSIKEEGVNLLSVDDHCYESNWYCDILLNQNLSAKRVSYQLSTNQLPLLGSKYALLRKEFLQRKPALKEEKKIRNILITFGGTDPDNCSSLVINALSNINADLSIRILIGGGNQHLEEIKKLATESKHDVKVKQNVSDMPTEYEWCDFVIGAGGSSCYEWIYYSKSGAVGIIADNQIPVYNELIKVGVFALGDLREENARRSLGENLKEALLAPKTPALVIDGYGAQRVASSLDGGCFLRSATHLDCQQYYDWAVDSEVREQSINSSQIEFSDHEKWFVSKLNSAGTLLYVLVDDEEAPVAQVRLESGDEAWLLSYSVDKKARGRGLGQKILSLTLNKSRFLGIKEIRAQVKPENVASHKVLQKSGFKLINNNPPINEYHIAL